MESRGQLVEKSCKKVSLRHIPEPRNKPMITVITLAITVLIACSYVLCRILILPLAVLGTESLENHPLSKVAPWRTVSFPLLVL